MVTRPALLLLFASSLVGCPAQPPAKTGQAPAKTASTTKTEAEPKTEAETTKPGPTKTGARPKPIGMVEKTRKGPRPIPLIKRPVRPPTKKTDARPDPETKPTGGRTLDLSKVVRAPARLRLGKEVKVGYKAKQVTQGPGYRGATWTAIVGQEDNAWFVEHVPYGIAAYAGLTAEASKMILGLHVSKVDGTVIKAVIGKAGEAGAPIRIFELPSSAAKPAPAAAKVQLKLKSGETLDAMRRAETLEGFGTVRTWTGVGPLEGVLLKTIDPKKTRELTGLPVNEKLTLGKVQLSALRCTYTDGDVTVVSDHPVVRGLFEGVVSMKTGEMTLALTSIETDAQPQLDWDSD